MITSRITNIIGLTLEAGVWPFVMILQVVFSCIREFKVNTTQVR